VYSTRVHARIANEHPREENRAACRVGQVTRILVRVRLVDDPRAEVGEDFRVGVGAVECQLNKSPFDSTLSQQHLCQKLRKSVDVH